MKRGNALFLVMAQVRALHRISLIMPVIFVISVELHVAVSLMSNTDIDD